MDSQTSSRSFLFSNLNFSQSRSSLTFLGFTLGVGLIVLSIIIDLITNNKSFDLISLQSIYQQNVTHWIILTSPFFLSTVFFVLGSMIKKREAVIKEQLKDEKNQFSILEGFIIQLQKENFEASIPNDFKNQNVATELERFKEKLVIEKDNEEKRSWENQGLANFGELLRKEADVEKLSNNVLQYLVRYLACNQGSLFLLDEAEEMLQLKACYAYDRKKFITKSIPIGEGLTGQCVLEKETILLYDIPQEYVAITSGLGHANPNCIVIVPLRHNDRVAGVVELASFKRLEKYQIEFLEKCAQAFASVIQAMTVNSNVKNLLEQSQQQMEELRSQEEEMRQNLEELQAIQEQMSRQLEENTKMTELLEAREKVLAQTTILSESDLYGTVTYVNEKFLEVSQYTQQELIGKGHNVVRHPDMPKEIFGKMWLTIKQGKTFRGIVKNRKKDGSAYWVDAAIVPIIQNGKIIKYIGARYHIKDAALAEILYNKQMEDFNMEMKQTIEVPLHLLN